MMDEYTKLNNLLNIIVTAVGECSINIREDSIRVEHFLPWDDRKISIAKKIASKIGILLIVTNDKRLIVEGDIDKIYRFYKALLLLSL